MASGREDYWTRVNPSRSYFGDGQEDIQLSDARSIVAGGWFDLINYTVPVGYSFLLTSFCVSVQYPGINQFHIRVNDVPMDQIYVDNNYKSVNDSGGLFKIASGSVFKIRCFNLDTINGAFVVYIYGYLDKI